MKEFEMINGMYVGKSYSEIINDLQLNKISYDDNVDDYQYMEAYEEDEEAYFFINFNEDLICTESAWTLFGVY
jgi:hypothetical protein